MQKPSNKPEKAPSEKAVKKSPKTNRICSYPKDYTWNELLKLLAEHAYELRKSGRTGGSRRRFIKSGEPPIILHEPHPSAILKEYQLKLVIEKLGIC